MRKLILSLSLLAVFAAFYGAGSYLRSFSISPRSAFFSEPALPEVSKGVQAVQATPGAPVASAAKPATTAEPARDPAEAVQKARGSELMHAMRAIPHVPYNRLHEALRRRFAEEYPSGKHEQLKEAASRVGILGALTRYKDRVMTRSEQQQLQTFFEEVAGRGNENPAVRDSATRGQFQFTGRMDEDQRSDIFARTPASQIDRASRPVHELVEEVIREAK